MKRVHYSSFLIACLLTAMPVVAQIGTSTMTGRVTDSTDAIVPGASITVVQTGTNFTFNTNTNRTGCTACFRSIRACTGSRRKHRVLRRSIRDQVELRTGDTLAVDFVLQVGNVSESVEVTGVASLLETETSSTGTLMSGTVLI